VHLERKVAKKEIVRTSIKDSDKHWQNVIRTYIEPNFRMDLERCIYSRRTSSQVQDLAVPQEDKHTLTQ
jgi:hypothetical protein